MIGTSSPDSVLLAFYRGAGTDHAGRQIVDILAWDHRRLEMVHDYIQWLFPVPEPSRFNTHAPLLTPKDITAFRTEPHLQATVRQALDMMLRFYGLTRHAGKIERATPRTDYALHWVQPLNHNYLRLTRILSFLRHAGLLADAQALLACLEDIAAHEGRDAIAPRTLAFWRDAVASS